MYTNRLNLQIGRDEAYKSACARLTAYQEVDKEGIWTIREIVCSNENLLFLKKRLKEYDVEITSILTGGYGCSYIYFNLADLHRVIRCLNKIFDMNVSTLKYGNCFYDKTEWLI